MTTLLQLNYPPTWNHCPVFLPYDPHTISVIVPGYLGLLFPFLAFSIFFFMYLYDLWKQNFEDDIHANVQNIQQMKYSNPKQLDTPFYHSSHK